MRTSLALAALLQRPIEITNIRAKRKKPGLRPQHLVAVQALAEITNAEIHGVHLDSTHLIFSPHALQGGKYHFTIQTAGSATLLLAAALPPLLFASTASQVVIEGGTHVPFSPPFHYLEGVMLPTIARMGAQATASLRRWGWYPEGGGKIRVDIMPCQGLRGIEWRSRGTLKDLELVVVSSNLPSHISDRECSHAENRLVQRGFRVRINTISPPAAGTGNMAFLKAEFEKTVAAFSALGKRGKPAEQVAEEVCRAWLSFSDSEAVIDSHLADQLLVFMALAAGRSSFLTQELTGHLHTNVKIIEQFLPVRFDIDHSCNKVSTEGIGYAPLTS